jgi:Uma2 family endonuclease
MSSSEHESQQSTLTQLVQPPKSRQDKGIHSLTWEQLEEIDRSPEGFPGIRLAYLDGTLEIMPISTEHEDFKSTISRLLETYLDEAKVFGYV